MRVENQTTSVEKHFLWRMARGSWRIGRRLVAPVVLWSRVFPRRCHATIARFRQKKVIIFESDWFGIYPFLRPLVRNCARSGQVLPVIATEQCEKPAFLKELNQDPALSQSGFIVMSFRELDSYPLSPDMIVSCQPYSQVADKYPKIPRIQTLHGCADKRGQLFGERNLRDFTHLFSPGPIITELAQERILHASASNADALKIEAIGYPKVDDLFDDTYSRDKVLQDLGLDPSLPTVLYAPAYEKEASWEQCGLEVIEQLASLDANILLKLHYLTLADPTSEHLIEHGHGGRDWRPVLKKLELSLPRFRFVDQPYANPFLKASDLLVTDISGIAIEFLLLDRPVVFIDTPLVTEKYGDLPLHTRLRSAGVVVDRLPELTEAIRTELAFPDAKKSERLRMIERLVYNRGKATDVAMNVIQGYLFGGG